MGGCIGQFPNNGGLFEPPRLAYFRSSQANVTGPARFCATMTDTSTNPHGPKRPAISFEFFPPKTAEMEKSLWETINRLAPLAPNFVSVTYGAGGSTRERTHSTIARILGETNLLPAAHLTCVGAGRGEIDDIVARYHATGVRHIVALRGDPATGIGTQYV